jgi:peroxiredoxin
VLKASESGRSSGRRRNHPRLVREQHRVAWRGAGDVMRSFVLLAAIVATVASAAWAGIDIGPAVGSTAPALVAVDMAGAPRTLGSIAGPKGTVLVFFRSAKWCPYCQRQLNELKAATGPLARRGYRLAAISYDAPSTLAGFAARQTIDYTLLSDTGSKMIDAYKLRDPQYAEGSFAYGVPKPAIFVLDRNGVVRGKLAEEGYKSRPPVAAITALLDTLKP